MIKKVFSISILLAAIFSVEVSAQPITYIVQPGDSMWKIATKYEVGISEIISSNPSVSNPSLIYPGQKLVVPTINDIKALENEVIRLVNVERVNRGIQPLTQNWQLSRVARYKSQDMISKSYFDHISPTYGSPFTMMENFGIKFTAAGENIAMGQNSPSAVMNSWMNSSGHRSNILSPAYNQIGVGLATAKNGTKYWTQQFIKSMY